MQISASTQKYRERMFPALTSRLPETDPEIVEIFDNFAFDEVINMPSLGGKEVDDRMRHIAILATLLGCQGIDEFRLMLQAAVNFGVTPTEIKEITYQAVPYLGMGRVFPFLGAVNEFLESRGVPLPLERQATVTAENRREAGTRAQVEIFGEHMQDFWKSGPEESRHINLWLAANCFGEFYTRGGLTLAERELVTFCFLAALGGCEPQLASHVTANIRLGNDRLFLVAIISHCLPFNGYPRSLNALACVKKVAESQ